MEPLESVATYPTNRDDWLLTVLIGGVIVFLGFLLIPVVFVYGYVIRVIKKTQTGDTEPPAFEDWGALFVDGLKAWVIGLIYLLIPGFVAAVTIGSALASLAAGGSPELTAGGLLLGLTLSAILALVFWYVAVAAISNFAREDSVSAAFDFTVLKQVVVHREYAVAWVVSLLVLAAASLVSAIPVLGWILAPFVSFYAFAVAGYLWSGGISAALDGQEIPERAGGEQAAV